MSPFEDFVDAESLDPDERERLRRVHELLLEVGPPPELSTPLAQLPAEVTRARVIRFPARRQLAGALAFAAALAAAAFGGGYLVGNNGGGFGAVRVAAMTGRNALGTVSVGRADTGGNWPIRFRATGLPRLSGKYAYYELFVLRNGKPAFPCGGFKVQGPGATQITFSVPYAVTNTNSWVLTAVDHSDHWPGRVVMT
jgi:hypothetical protein